MPSLAVYVESGAAVGTVTLQSHTLDTLFECHSITVELYGRARTILKLCTNQCVSIVNGITCPQLLIKLIKGEQEVIDHLDYAALAYALERVPPNGEPIRIYHREQFEDHNIRNI